MESATRDLLLYVAGILGLAATFLHGYLGETRVFARGLIEPERLRTLIRLVWHCSVVAWAAVAVLLIAVPSMGSPAAPYWIVGAAVVVFGFAAIANAWATRAFLRLGRVDGQGRPGGWPGCDTCIFAVCGAVNAAANSNSSPT